MTDTLIHQPQPMNQLARIANQLHRLNGVCPNPGLTMSQVSTLAFLAMRGNEAVYQKDIESYFQLRRSTVSSMLNTLEKKDMIQRQTVSHDARLKRLVLTEEGHRVSEQLHEVFLRMNSLFLQGLSSDEVAALTAILTKIEANLSQASE